MDGALLYDISRRHLPGVRYIAAFPNHARLFCLRRVEGGFILLGLGRAAEGVCLYLVLPTWNMDNTLGEQGTSYGHHNNNNNNWRHGETATASRRPLGNQRTEI